MYDPHDSPGSVVIEAVFWTEVIFMPICFCVAVFCAQLGCQLVFGALLASPIHALPNAYVRSVLSEHPFGILVCCCCLLLFT